MRSQRSIQRKSGQEYDWDIIKSMELVSMLIIWLSKWSNSNNSIFDQIGMFLNWLTLSLHFRVISCSFFFSWEFTEQQKKKGMTDLIIFGHVWREVLIANRTCLPVDEEILQLSMLSFLCNKCQLLNWINSREERESQLRYNFHVRDLFLQGTVLLISV